MNLEVPVNIALTNTSDKVVAFRYFKPNFVQELQPSEFVKLTVKTSDELDYYINLNDSKIGLVCDTSIDVASIAVKTAPTKTTYSVGETFDPAGMVIEATDEYGDKHVVTTYTYEPTGALELTDSKITITYSGKTCEQAITVE